MSINGDVSKSPYVNKENITIINIKPTQVIKDERIAAIVKKFKNLDQLVIVSIPKNYSINDVKAKLSPTVASILDGFTFDEDAKQKKDKLIAMVPNNVYSPQFMIEA